MNAADLKYKLTTVLSVDVAGFGRLMCRDEIKTVIMLSNYRKIISELVQQNRGRVVDAVGVTTSWPNSAAPWTLWQVLWAIQRRLQSKNAELKEDKRMLFRIGINCRGMDIS